MFTGLIQEQGKVVQMKRQGQTIQLTCQTASSFLGDYEIGDSMALNGVCLTAIAKNRDRFTVDVMPATFQRTNLAKLKINDWVNLERALAFNGRLEGHLVAGHVDTMIRLLDKRENENALILTFEYPADRQGEIIPQGSVALNGVSLTVTELGPKSFSVSLIPHSKGQTNLGNLKRSDFVNLETDLIGKYVLQQAKLFENGGGMKRWKE